MKLRLRKLGKKGAIPVINEIILTFLNVTPKPILFLIFIFIITALATFLVPQVLNFFGYECVQQGANLQLYQVPMDKIGQKALSDLKQNVRQVAGLTDYQLPTDPFPNGDTKYLRVPAECFNDVVINGSTRTGYSSACVNCTYSGVFRYWGSICLSDGYYSPDLITKYWIGTANFCYKCSPPEPYYFNYSYCFSEDNCFFRITDPSLAGAIISEDYQANYYYQQIIQLGGVLRQQDSSEFANIQCAGVNRPDLYFFSIRVFDQKLWIYLFIAYALIMFAFFWYNITGINR